MRSFLHPNTPAIVLAPMDGLADAAMRAALSELSFYSYSVSEFIRVSTDIPPVKVFRRDVPELCQDGCTPSGMPVQVQILGGDPERMAETARTAVRAGAHGVDINFGCPAPTVNRHDGGASLLRFPCRIKDIVQAVREAVPPTVPVSAKLRLGWDTIDAIVETSAAAIAGGASWLTIHGRTRVQGYKPPALWEPIGAVCAGSPVPVVANGDIWTRDDFLRCQDVTGCRHFMIGRGALANPTLSHDIARELGLVGADDNALPSTWTDRLERLMAHTSRLSSNGAAHALPRMKQWLSIASRHGTFAHFDALKRCTSTDELLALLAQLERSPERSLVGAGTP